MRIKNHVIYIFHTWSIVPAYLYFILVILPQLPDSILIVQLTPDFPEVSL